jgi:putative aldouronate transport system permease protein
MAKKKEEDNNVYAVRYKETGPDKVFNVINLIIMIFIALIIIYPLYYVVIASFTKPEIVNKGTLLLFTIHPYLEGYKRAIAYRPLWLGYGNTLLYSFVGTIVALICTIPAGYALSRRDLPVRRVIMFLFTFTMFFSGGIIPLYLVIRKLGLYDSIWAIVLPVALSPYNLIVCRSFFDSSMPVELQEAAQLDGCTDFDIFFKVALPLSTTIIAVMALFYGTALWNMFFNPLMFLASKDKMPLQVVLRDLILQNQIASMTNNAEEIAMRQRMAEQLKYVIVVLAAAPPLIIYPFLQKYFVKGVTVGAVKG